uniref:Uncharacterized protein n=1 Tax=Timema tahoe TaxID=61484 RepID=A0A7R9ID60_9NEOP|nr:unnamed protein product [Timema tahoe]
MRFRFCGDLDCPDWILAEINTLAKMSSVKMKLLCQQVAKSSLGEEMDTFHARHTNEEHHSEVKQADGTPEVSRTAHQTAHQKAHRRTTSYRVETSRRFTHGTPDDTPKKNQ